MIKPGLVFFLCILAFSCTITENKPQETPAPKSAYAGANAMIAEGESLLKDGDLLVRTGVELSSQMIRQLNRTEKKYSHSGVILFENGYPFVYHIVTGDENPDCRLKKDSVANFCNPRKNSGFAVYRFNLEEKEKEKFRQQIDLWYGQGVKFDSLFSLKTDDRMYCSEMIKKRTGRV